MDEATLRELIEGDEFGLLELPVKPVKLTSDQLLASQFQEILDFVEQHGHEPVDDVTDMQQATLAWRLRGIRADSAQVEALLPVDTHQLLVPPKPPESLEEALAGDLDGLLGSDDAEAIFDTSALPKSPEMPDEIARPVPVENFEEWEPRFSGVHDEIRSGARKVKPFKQERNIRSETYFVLRGVLCYVADQEEPILDEKGKNRARMRVIFENGTEARYMNRSFARALYRHGRRVTDPEAVTWQEMGLDPATKLGFVYVLRSLSDDPQVTSIPNLHKIGFTNQSVEQRLKNHADFMTFLKAPVEVVAEYEMPAVMASQIEGLLHRLFAAVRVDASFETRGVAIGEATEWFSVPLAVINDAIELFPTGAITSYEYDPSTQRLELIGHSS